MIYHGRTEKEHKAFCRKQAVEYLLKWPIEWGFIKDGVDSGYSPCCIVWYKIRLLFLYTYEIIFGHCKLFQSPSRTFYKEADYQAYINSDEFKRRPSHILCPCHRLYRRIYNYPVMPYHRCEKCGWTQYKNKKCTRC